jgi:hypothetical protein
MVTWLYQADRRLTPAEQRSQPIDRTCLLCGGVLLRLAEREPDGKYRWRPNGRICATCNAMYLEFKS